MTMQDALFDLTGKVALVTGASSGLGRRFAYTLAEAGADVIVAARRAERLHELAGEIAGLGRRGEAVSLDVSDPASIDATIATAWDSMGRVDILVNNAGVALTKPFLEQTVEDWDLVLDTNLKGAFLVAQATARRMVDAGEGGNIVNIASIIAQRVEKQLVGYAASKAGLVQVTKTMALELARHGIRVNALAPGYVVTEINRDFLEGEAGEKMKRGVPMRRFGQVEDLDGPLLLLASDASRYMTGSVVTVDGGHTLSLP